MCCRKEKVFCFFLPKWRFNRLIIGSKRRVTQLSLTKKFIDRFILQPHLPFCKTTPGTKRFLDVAVAKIC